MSSLCWILLFTCVFPILKRLMKRINLTSKTLSIVRHIASGGVCSTAGGGVQSSTCYSSIAPV